MVLMTMAQTCLIVVDMLHDFLDPWEPDRRNALIKKTNELVAAFRQSNRPVIWVRIEFKADLSDAFLEMRDKGIRSIIEGTPGVAIHKGLAVDPGDTVIVKKRYSAFFGTDLDRILADLEATRLVLTGVNTHACVRMTAIDAYQRDLQVVLAADCVGSYDDEHARVSLRYMDGKIAAVMGNAEIIGALNAPGD